MLSSIFVWLCVIWFKMRGWRIPKRFPVGLKQYVLAVAPHTSNIDFPIGVAARKLLGLNVQYVAKKELFKFPIAGVLKSLGGYPIDRSKKTNFVEQVVSLFQTEEDFAICVTPEGTRSRVETWKTGFYHMAMKAGVPIMMVGFDYPLRVVVVSDPFMPTGDMEADFAQMDRFFEKIVPKNPANSKYTLK